MSLVITAPVAAPIPGADPWAGVFSAALRNGACTVHGLHPAPTPLPVPDWSSVAGDSDRVVLGHCVDPTLDIGCGPGRMTQALVIGGLHAMGIDVAEEAVGLARRRGVAALRRDVFGPVPGEGRWGCALLADGNIGIGGDPVALLRRVHTLLTPGGRAVVDLAPPGVGLRTETVRIESQGLHSAPFRWSLLGPESVRDVARSAGFVVGGLHEYDGRWFAVLEKGGLR